MTIDDTMRTRQLIITVLLLSTSFAAGALPEQCNRLCNCASGSTFCARVNSRLGPHQMQYPGCLNQCFDTCCQGGAKGSLTEVKEGGCLDEIFVQVVTGTHADGPVGLVEPCPEIYLAAITKNRTKN
ncbi:uncharacterized protein LOC132193536 isoform X2 [Neocloeon triangulifer]|uniref:uncharacterized protein LOC132193536 isoform X2 n=1 Tax=Neocloeon triangulifer TaxID=2078957 RepID=UPI00286F70A1|nr:uncharacterized protein LOC132193536 isoform X2 [Neocloeon triangulifer]